MSLSSHNRAYQMEDCFVFDSFADLQADEAVPLLKHSSHQNFEMAPVHMTEPQVSSSDTSRVNFGVNSFVNMNSKYSYFQSFSEANVNKALQMFWRKKLQNENPGLFSFADEALITYTVEPVTRPPFTCYITLPNGCCFGNLLSESGNSMAARRSAASVALVNSLYNELPCRKIDTTLIETVIHEATVANTIVHGSSSSLEGVKVFRSILESIEGRTMLDYRAFVNQLLAMQWSGTLELMSQHGASQQQVLEAASSQHWFTEDSRSEMALTWISVERQEPGSITAVLTKAMSELRAAQRCGHELAFPLLKRDVLQLAASNVS